MSTFPDAEIGDIHLSEYLDPPRPPTLTICVGRQGYARITQDDACRLRHYLNSWLADCSMQHGFAQSLAITAAVVSPGND